MLQAPREAEDMLEDRELAAFLANRILWRATERGVEFIGEASLKATPKDARSASGSIGEHVSLARLCREILQFPPGLLENLYQWVVNRSMNQ
jgi:uncharacterized protein with HEPN domain